MNGSHNISISDEDKILFLSELGIKSDIDFRTANEAGNITESPLGNSVQYYHYPITAYDEGLSAEDISGYTNIFQTLADENNYPVYLHCYGGADRTGTVCYLLNGLLGVSYEDLTRDYELTSFSVFGIRSRRETAAFGNFVNYIDNNFGGTTLQERIELFMHKKLGITQEETDSIKSILLK